MVIRNSTKLTFLSSAPSRTKSASSSMSTTPRRDGSDRIAHGHTLLHPFGSDFLACERQAPRENWPAQLDFASRSGLNAQFRAEHDIAFVLHVRAAGKLLNNPSRSRLNKVVLDPQVPR